MNHIEQELNKLKRYLTSNNNIKISLASIEEQLNLFINGIKIPKLVRPCTIGDGIVQIKKSEYADLITISETIAKTGRLMKFVPASGAASRMFQKLQSVINRSDKNSLEEIKKRSKDNEEFKSVYEFLINISKFAFYDELKTILTVDDAEIESRINEIPGRNTKCHFA